ncbi:hypothetical protein ABZW03_03700, partial [Kitasatospora sp. NPDC004799]
ALRTRRAGRAGPRRQAGRRVRTGAGDSYLHNAVDDRSRLAPIGHHHPEHAALTGEPAAGRVPGLTRHNDQTPPKIRNTRSRPS